MCIFSPEICHCLETTQTATLDSISEVGPCVTPAPAASTAPADSCSNSPAAEAATAESEEDEKENSALNQTKAKGEEIVVVTDRTVEHEKMQDGTDKETGAPAADLSMTDLIRFSAVLEYM